MNAAADTQIAGIANWLLNVGAVDEVRFPVVTVRLAKAAAAGLFAALPGLRPGDYLQITNPPSFLTASTIKQLAFGYSETIGVNQWDLSFNTVPESPYETGFSPGTVQTAQLPGSGAVTSTAPGAGGLGGIIANGFITPSMLNEGITVKTLGGNRITISAGAPANPDTNDIWIASATALISQWDGAAWQPYKLDGAAGIQAGTIVAANIATSTLTASLIAAGQVYAGFVDATNIFANTYVATNAAGEFLAYDAASPSAGHLINSIAGAAGTDSQSNAYPKGLLSQQLTLLNQGSAPPSFTGSSVLYSSTAGRLRYLSSAGSDNCIVRQDVNVSQFSMGTQTIAQAMSGPLNYLAGEGSQSSEYEIEVDGIVKGPTSGSGSVPTWDMMLYLDGSLWGATFTCGTVMFPLSSVSVSYTVRFRAAILTTGAGGTAILASDGQFCRQGANLGNTTVQTAAGASSGGTTKSFDTTSNHTLQVYAAWSSVTATGHSAVTYRTRITRRM